MPLTVNETAEMTAIKIAYRSALLVTVIVTGYMLTVVFQRAYNSDTKNNIGKNVIRWWHKKVIQVMGVSVRVFGKPAEETTLFISNHISWFDISAFGSILPVRFLAKIEVKKMPVMGWLASQAGTLYIQRGSKTSTSNTISSMTEALEQENHVVLFAEGTTQDGTINRFHSRLVQSAINAECHVQPVAIRYPSLNDKYVHPAALFVGETTIGQSILNIMTAKNLVAEIHFLEPVKTDGKNRDELTSYAEDQVRELIENAASAK
jgi:1-acyl-sn-glycerol-3-phosphate acyltransferase